MLKGKFWVEPNERRCGPLYVAKHVSPNTRGKLGASALIPGGILYLELLLRLFDTDNNFFTWGLLRTALQYYDLVKSSRYFMPAL